MMIKEAMPWVATTRVLIFFKRMPINIYSEEDLAALGAIMAQENPSFD
jgi:hypothetical protein